MSNRLKIAICEDEANDAQILSGMINNSGLLCDYSVFDSAEMLLPRLSEFDLFLLDIYLGGISGVELARKIRTKNEDCEIVFTTVSDAHALEGFEVNALQYLVKPLDTLKVSAMLNRFIKVSDRRDSAYCTVVVNRNDVDIYFRDIHYVKAFDKYCSIYTKDGVIETYSTLDCLFSKLPKPPFLRCHRGCIVNMDYVQNVNGDFIMNNGDVVYIRQSERDKIKKEYMQYLVERTRGETREKVSV